MSSYRSKLIISLGPVQGLFDLNSAFESSKTGLKSLCPTHHEQAKQRYVCPVVDEVDGVKPEADSHEIPWGTWDKAAVTAEGWRIASEGDRPEFERSESIELVPVLRAEVEQGSYPGGSMYYMTPSTKSNSTAYSALRKVLTKGKYVFIAKAALRRGWKKLWVVDLLNGALVLREAKFPSDIREAPETELERVPKATTDMLVQYVENIAVPWDDLDTSNENEERLLAWINEGELIDKPVSPVADGAQEAIQGVVDLQAALKKVVGL